MKKRLVVMLMLIVSCGPQPPIFGSADSNVRQLREGMTTDQVGAIVGAHQLESFNASSGDTSCRSYEYDETIDRKYVHAFFLDGKLVKATDGHRKLCVFRGDTK